MRKILVVALALALPACASQPFAVKIPATNAQTTPVARSNTLPQTTVRKPQVMREGGLSGVIGARAQALKQRFGNARIELVEGDARKLQFAGDECVLDIFLYPLEANTAPVATHVEARLRKDGRDTDRTQCIAELAR